MKINSKYHLRIYGININFLFWVEQLVTTICHVKNIKANRLCTVSNQGKVMFSGIVSRVLEALQILKIKILYLRNNTVAKVNIH